MKKILAIVLVMVTLCSALCFAGCSEKISLTAEDFKTAMEARGCTVVDATEQLSEYEEITRVYIALLGDGDHQIEFYETSTAEAAQRLYAGNKGIFEESIVGASAQSSSSAANYNSYRLTADGYYKVLSRIDNTMIYVNSPEEYKGEIKDILESLGY